MSDIKKITPADEQNRMSESTTSDRQVRFPTKQLIGRRMIKEAAEFVSEHISRQPPVQRFFSFMPTLLTHVSPFHFKGRAKQKDWPLIRLDSGDVNSWGRMRVVGELLVIFDETVLFCLLSLMTKYQNDAFETTGDELCHLAGIDPTPHQQKAVWKSIQRLSGTRIDLELTSGSGKKKKSLKALTGSILSFGDMDRGTGRIRIMVNPYFIEMYADSFVTNIDLRFRASLKSDISKAFYRFYQGQYPSDTSISILKLAQAVNLNIHQPMNRLRAKVRTGLRELQSGGYLKRFDISKDNVVDIIKAGQTSLDIDGQILAPSKIFPKIS